MKVLLLSYSFDGTDVGESLVAYKWAQALTQRVDLTVLGLERQGRRPLEQQLHGAHVVTWPEPKFLLRATRFNAMLKPAYLLLHRHVRRWLRDQHNQGLHYDIGHQIMPQAARYPCPFRGMGIPYIIGPLGGALSTPKGFRHELGSAKWYTRLRALDQWRLRHDPWLTRSYAEADMILGVAPYVKDLLADLPLRRFEPVLELGIDDLAPAPSPAPGPGLRLLHVGRGVRTKGLRDAVRALALLKDIPGLTLISAGTGEEIELSRREAEALGVAGRVTFLGQIPKEQVEKLYRQADVFVFPSVREPAGGVLYEAMRAGLPVITVNYGGPAFIVDDSSGVRLPISTPDALARDIAEAVRTFYHDPERRRAMGLAGREKVGREGLWPNKVDQIMGLYQEVLAARSETTP